MISITCTQCRTVLTIDEAFAGGVCRCQHCGTIQTVPKAAATASSSFNPAATTSKSLYQTKSGRNTSGNIATSGATSPSGLDDLAQAVVSSGLSGSGLRRVRGRRDSGPSRILATDPARPNWSNRRPHSPARKGCRQEKIPDHPYCHHVGGVVGGRRHRLSS